jgi:hypothetical protein
MHVPHVPDDMHIDPYTGIVTWETGLSPHHKDPASYPDPSLPRASGLEADELRRTSFQMLQPPAVSAGHAPNGAPVATDSADKQAVLDVVYNAGVRLLSVCACRVSLGMNLRYSVKRKKCAGKSR